jgi:alkanesulfonate monooxygenase SsuD/methylene tetrahydromethanopterin reductase-like flavin-dependent oxidoreductase (luciferase family)
LEYFVNMPGDRFKEPAAWAKDMEQAGWDGVCASDHLWVSDHPYPHVFVAATQMACATRSIKITTSFCNNLFRSPIEFAQGALSLNRAASGRFEAGLGAGWAEPEMRAMGMDYPDPPDRMGRYIEAMQIARSLLATGQCEFNGDYYNVSITGDNSIGPMPDSKTLLIGSAGGPRGLREITPLVDRMEIKASARSTRGGQVDLAIMATVTEDEVKRNIERARNVSETIPLGIFILTAAGDNKAVQGMKAMMGNGYLGNFMGHPDDVGRALESLGQLGIDRVQLTEFVQGSHQNLAGLLL